MTPPAHTFSLQPWSNSSTSVRLVCEAANMMLWPLQPDDRLSVIVSLLANNISAVATSDDEIDAVVELLRLQLKLSVTDSPPLQGE